MTGALPELDETAAELLDVVLEAERRAGEYGRRLNVRRVAVVATRSTKRKRRRQEKVLVAPQVTMERETGFEPATLSLGTFRSGTVECRLTV
jgi:hypothetical protein